ncbi:C40 family peptidase [Thiothrix fructosivorans]|uniref:C40 family peptidase n=1 Tax=Thiothrix fructosivorans TaxID=111770 RepID=A0A8B0SG59_9GAMM|nr:C40 family peptidase [Thiothrix fructosivorans]MBO0613974.1 C40 family peptidase [Thiothrix fructosivorans]QTX10336.1 C40 family peptidase [Thiothrix fructosivorans]
MGKFNAALLTGTAAAFLGGCAPVTYYPQTAQYPYWNHTVPGAYQGNYQGEARPYYTSYNPSNTSQPTYSQQYQPFSQQAEPADAPARRALLAQAHQALGVRYTYGGESPGTGFDCSGLTQYVYKNAQGIKLPRTAAEQSQASRTLSFEEMRPGDLIFFRTSGSTVNHVGIYVGRGNFIHAASGGSKVTLDNLSKTYWQQRLVKFGAFLA